MPTCLSAKCCPGQGALHTRRCRQMHVNTHKFVGMVMMRSWIQPLQPLAWLTIRKSTSLVLHTLPHTVQLIMNMAFTLSLDRAHFLFHFSHNPLCLSVGDPVGRSGQGQLWQRLCCESMVCLYVYVCVQLWVMVSPRGLQGVHGVCGVSLNFAPNPPMYTHTRKYAEKVFFLCPLWWCWSVSEEQSATHCYLRVFLGIKRGFCLQFGLVTCEHEPRDI